MTKKKSYVAEVNLETICKHEAGHAVMRWLQGMKCTDIVATEKGGAVFGSGEKISNFNLLHITLGGFAVESNYGFMEVEFKSCHGADWECARTLIGQHIYLRSIFQPKTDQSYIASVEVALKYHFTQSCDMLRPYDDLIEEMGEALMQSGRLSRRMVMKIIRDWVKTEGYEDLYLPPVW